MLDFAMLNSPSYEVGSKKSSYLDDFCAVGVDGGDPSTSSKNTRCDRVAHDGIVAAVAYLGFLGVCSSHLMLPNKIICCPGGSPTQVARSRRVLFEAEQESPAIDAYCR
ncbi:hypothetical protein Y032_0909g2994 [Ancylostoma ceylanicum]|uniref:Uncharacterized protein n=1 Tax=Ancylostoma ceylanicum TaxID=53326 RepID=A0A016W8W9_9BILA|nr:hypothetical protein Y032_0909g2994 [Ancylostoma ceylanicum]